MGKFGQYLTELPARDTKIDMKTYMGYYSLTILFLMSWSQYFVSIQILDII